MKSIFRIVLLLLFPILVEAQTGSPPNQIIQEEISHSDSDQHLSFNYQ